MVKSSHNTTTLSHQQKKQHQSKRVDMRKGGGDRKKGIVIPNFIEEETTTATTENNNNKNHQSDLNDDRNNNKVQQDSVTTTDAAATNDSEQQKAPAAATEERASRKERRKEFLQKRLERKLSALERIHDQNDKLIAAAAEQGKQEGDGEGDKVVQETRRDKKHEESQGGGSSNDDNGNSDDDGEREQDGDDDDAPKKHQSRQAAAAAAAPRRAALGGTYWKERKEKKGRTIFVGGIPGGAGLGLVRRLLNTYGADGAIKDPKQEIEVDFIKPKSHEAANFRSAQKKHTIPKNAYCVMPTKELAKKASDVLDGVWVHPDEVIPMTDKDANSWRPHQSTGGGKPSKLRVNFADDKSQREVAISKRKGGDGDKDSYYKKSLRAKSGFRQHAGKNV